MPLVRNRSEVPHRYYDYGRKAYLVWSPGGGQGRAPRRSSAGLSGQPRQDGTVCADAGARARRGSCGRA